MEDERAVRVEQLKARISRADYQVDADRVAEAIVARLLQSGRSLPPYGAVRSDVPATAFPPRGARPAHVSDDVLEAR